MDHWVGSCQEPLLIDDEEPPPAIDIIAENYRFKLSGRMNVSDSGLPTVRTLIPILIIDPPDCAHSPQTFRVVHFVRQPNDVIPRNAQIFDFESAMGEYHEKQYEYQQYVINEALRRCGPPAVRPKTGSFTAQRTMLRLSCERPAQKCATAGITLPSKRPQPPKKKFAPVRPVPGESITISRVTVPDQRRAKASKRPAQKTARTGGVREDLSARKARSDGGTTPRRYRSPPPKQPAGKWLQASATAGGRCARGDYAMQVQQVAELAAEMECSHEIDASIFGPSGNGMDHQFQI
jgi:hypothetical protein